MMFSLTESQHDTRANAAFAIGFAASFFLLSCQSPGQQTPPAHAPSGTSYRRPVIPDSIVQALPKEERFIGEYGHFNMYVFGKVDTALISSVASRLEVATASLVEAFPDQSAPLVDVVCYPTCEVKGLRLFDNHRASIDSSFSKVHVVLNRHYQELTPSAPLEVFLRKMVGKPASPALECGFAVSVCDAWQRLGASELACRLAAADLVPDLSDLLDMALWYTWSDIVAQALLADFVTYLRKTRSSAEFRQLYMHASPRDLLVHEKAWRAALYERAAKYEKTDSPTPPSWLQGFNFSHDGYQIYNGYGSEMAHRALEATVALGSNAAAVVPYSFLRDASSPAPIPIARFPGGENDDAVLGTCHHARELGLYVLLKPQIWLGRGRWPGDIEMESEAAWQAFFSYYTYWIAHYALLAEIHQIDGLCIGTELTHTTLKRPYEWRFLIQRLRWLYHGHLTYAANWGEEFEKLSFWPELDYMGLDFYYPLSAQPDPSDSELRQAMQDILKKIGKVASAAGKKVVLTEVGYPTTNTPWIEPHNDSRTMPFDPVARNRCFRILFDNLHDLPWLAGIFIWKYPTFQRPQRRSRPSFEIPGTEAEDIIRQAFSTRLPAGSEN